MARPPGSRISGGTPAPQLRQRRSSVNTASTPGSASAARGVDPDDRARGRAGLRTRASVDGAGQADVVDVAAAAGDEAAVFLALDRRADHARDFQVFVPPGLQVSVDVGHEIGPALAEHDLQIRGLEAHVLVAVDDLGRARHAVPLSEHRFDALAGAVLEEHLHLALQDEEDLFDLVTVRRVALARRHEHDAEREVLGRNVAAIGLAGGAVADEAVLSAAIAIHARVGERVPVSGSVSPTRDLAIEKSGQRFSHARILLRPRLRRSGRILSEPPRRLGAHGMSEAI